MGQSMAAGSQSRELRDDIFNCTHKVEKANWKQGRALNLPKPNPTALITPARLHLLRFYNSPQAGPLDGDQSGQIPAPMGTFLLLKKNPHMEVTGTG